LRDAWPKRIAPAHRAAIFDRDETPAIFVTSLVFDQRQVVRHVEPKYYRRRRAAWPFCAVSVWVPIKFTVTTRYRAPLFAI
jgi:hypothetical protein